MHKYLCKFVFYFKSTKCFFLYCYDRLSKTLLKRVQKTRRNNVRWVSIKLLSTGVRRIRATWRPRRTKIATQCHSKHNVKKNKYKVFSCSCFFFSYIFWCCSLADIFSDTFCMATALAKWTEATTKRNYQQKKNNVKANVKKEKGKFKLTRRMEKILCLFACFVYIFA